MVQLIITHTHIIQTLCQQLSQQQSAHIAHTFTVITPLAQIQTSVAPRSILRDWVQRTSLPPLTTGPSENRQGHWWSSYMCVCARPSESWPPTVHLTRPPPPGAATGSTDLLLSLVPRPHPQLPTAASRFTVRRKLGVGPGDEAIPTASCHN